MVVLVLVSLWHCKDINDNTSRLMVVKHHKFMRKISNFLKMAQNAILVSPLTAWCALSSRLRWCHPQRALVLLRSSRWPGAGCDVARASLAAASPHVRLVVGERVAYQQDHKTRAEIEIRNVYSFLKTAWGTEHKCWHFFHDRILKHTNNLFSKL